MTTDNKPDIVENTISLIEQLIADRKIKYLSDTIEFVEGLLIGLEVSKIYGKDIENYSKTAGKLLPPPTTDTE